MFPAPSILAPLGWDRMGAGGEAIEALLGGGGAGGRVGTTVAPTPSPRGFESLASFLFRGAILRMWCHQRVEGQG